MKIPVHFNPVVPNGICGPHICEIITFDTFCRVSKDSGET